MPSQGTSMPGKKKDEIKINKTCWLQETSDMIFYCTQCFSLPSPENRCRTGVISWSPSWQTRSEFFCLFAHRDVCVLPCCSASFGYALTYFSSLSKWLSGALAPYWWGQAQRSDVEMLDFCCAKWVCTWKMQNLAQGGKSSGSYVVQHWTLQPSCCVCVPKVHWHL